MYGVQRVRAEGSMCGCMRTHLLLELLEEVDEGQPCVSIVQERRLHEDSEETADEITTETVSVCFDYTNTDIAICKYCNLDCNNGDKTRRFVIVHLWEVSGWVWQPPKSFVSTTECDEPQPGITSLVGYLQPLFTATVVLS